MKGTALFLRQVLVGELVGWVSIDEAKLQLWFDTIEVALMDGAECPTIAGRSRQQAFLGPAGPLLRNLRARFNLWPIKAIPQCTNLTSFVWRSARTKPWK